MHEKGILRMDEIRESDVWATYWFTSELSIFNMRNNKKLKEKHGVKEHLLIIPLEEIAPSHLIRFEFGILLDFDVTMINQFIFTFVR
jgi:hypothetical protein